MNKTPLVSILVPIYNVEQHLGKCLDSIFSQTYENLEYVFVDDCSTDNSLDVLATSLAKHNIPNEKATIIKHKANEGIAVSRNDCIKNAHGEYVQFIDSDDWIEPNMTEELVKATNEGKIDIIGCDYAKDFLSEKKTFHKENYAETCHENMLRSLNYDISTVLWKLLIRKQLFNCFQIDPNINIGEDYIISIKLFYYANSFSCVHKFLYHYVQHNTNRLSFQIRRSLNDHIKAVKAVEYFCRDKEIYNERTRHLIMLRKFNIKSNFLTKNLLDYNEYRTTFPEANRIWREMGYSRNEKIKFWLAEKKLYFILKMILGKQSLNK